MTTQIRYGVNPQSIRRGVDALVDRARPVAVDVAQRAAAQMEEAVRDTAEFDGINPRVYAAMGAVVENTPNGPSVQLRPLPGATPEQEIAAAVAEYGRRGYTVVPRTRNALKFEWVDGTQYAKSVYIPPVGGTNVLRRARDRVYQRLRRGTI